MDTRSSPRIPFAIDEGESRVADVETTKPIDVGNIGWLSQVEGISADKGRVVDVDSARDKRQLVLRHSATSLEISPPMLMMSIRITRKKKR